MRFGSSVSTILVRATTRKSGRRFCPTGMHRPSFGRPGSSGSLANREPDRDGGAPVLRPASPGSPPGRKPAFLRPSARGARHPHRGSRLYAHGVRHAHRGARLSARGVHHAYRGPRPSARGVRHPHRGARSSNRGATRAHLGRGYSNLGADRSHLGRGCSDFGADRSDLGRGSKGLPPAPCAPLPQSSFSTTSRYLSAAGSSDCASQKYASLRISRRLVCLPARIR